MKTQIQKARKGIITPEMVQAAAYDSVDTEWLRKEIAAGRCVIPKNVRHNFSARAIGNGLTVKINANIGTSQKHCELPEEIAKMKAALKYGTDAVMDLSTGGNLKIILKTILEESPVMVGTVPVYGLAVKFIREGKNMEHLDPEEFFSEIEEQASMGVDFMTLHCGVTRDTVRWLRSSPRITGIVSRGGALLYRYIEATGKENPLYEQFDRILEICEKYDVTLSLGDGLRPGSCADANDASQIAELMVQGELVEHARERGVQVMVEGPGHMPLNQIEMSIRMMKRICHDAPLYVLGPLTTDAAAGYDHIAGAIGGAVAAASGADFLCYVTPAEHLCLPTEDDVRLGVIASRIAAHSANVARKIPAAIRQNNAVSQARFLLDWEKMFQNLLEPEYARRRKSESESSGDDFCSMCGELCAVKTFKDTL